MAVKIVFNQANLNKIFDSAALALGGTAEALKTEVVQDQVVPFDDGTLQDSMAVDKSQVNNGRAELTLSTPYARRLYFHPEYNFRKTNNPNAKGEWLEDYLPGGSKGQFAEKTFASLYKKYTGV